MRVGYLVGGTLSLLFYKLDRKHIVSTFRWGVEAKIKNKKAVNIIYLLLTALVASAVYLIPESEAINGIVAFGVLEIVGAVEKKSGNNFNKGIKIEKNLSRKRKIINKNINDRKVFYETLTLLGKSLIGSFITPLLIIVFFGNGASVAYGMIYFYFDELAHGVGEKILNIIFILPSLIGDGLLYLIYICRNKTFKISFKGEFFQNLFYMPLLNVYILGAYIETVNFYYFENYEVVHYIKSYGVYQGKIDEVATKDLVTIIYGVAGVAFILFIVLINLNLKFII
ncbi:hypothetical protein [Clostridium culturomicium]|uniref:hypothetical protein n=1 Tax=Clostridium culturomicium TaxID=1499683 RepID=UPI00058C640A|nr:hypothetical protein [Clostridium culturomicium]